MKKRAKAGGFLKMDSLLLVNFDETAIELFFMKNIVKI